MKIHVHSKLNRQQFDWVINYLKLHKKKNVNKHQWKWNIIYLIHGLYFYQKFHK